MTCGIDPRATCSGSESRLLPSWPATWDVDFKLHAPSNTTVRLKFQNGATTQLEASPTSRTNSIIPPPVPTAPPTVPTGLVGAPGDSKVTLSWTASSGV